MRDAGDLHMNIKIFFLLLSIITFSASGMSRLCMLPAEVNTEIATYFIHAPSQVDDPTNPMHCLEPIKKYYAIHEGNMLEHANASTARVLLEVALGSMGIGPRAKDQEFGIGFYEETNFNDLLECLPQKAREDESLKKFIFTMRLKICEGELPESVTKGRIERIQELVKLPINVDIAIGDGTGSPFMYACTQGRLGIAQILLDAGADPEFRTTDNESARDWLVHTITDEARRQHVRNFIDSAIAKKYARLALKRKEI